MLGRLKPYTQKERPPCPFYGFDGETNFFIDTSGNQCAMTGTYTPCQREMENLRPCWKECALNTAENRKNLKEISKIIRVFPDDFQPPKALEWEGVSLKKWMRYFKNKK